MNIIEIIEKKRDKIALQENEIKYFVEGYVSDTIQDYQASALMMAICINGMQEDEIYYLTKAMMESGECVDLSSIALPCVDKHSTGGVGDKTTLALGPMLAACGVCVAKMSGRGLSHTGGTIDKLESIPGFQVEVNTNAYLQQLHDIHIAVIGQSDTLVVADKKMYALRDVSGSVPSIPLIASSIMSKKLAAGCDTILLDVKYGDGAFMKTKEDAVVLAQTMQRIGTMFHKTVKAEITNMNQPLGNAIGNSLEVMEAIATLQGKGPKDFEYLCLHSGATLLQQANIVKTHEEGVQKLQESIANGKALAMFTKMVEYQKGDTRYIKDVSLFKRATYEIGIPAIQKGFVASIACTEIGGLACDLGAGRKIKEDTIQHEVGVILKSKVGTSVEVGSPLCIVHTNQKLTDEEIKRFQACFHIQEEKPDEEPLIYTTI